MLSFNGVNPDPAGCNTDKETSNGEKKYWLERARHRLRLSNADVRKVGIPTLPRYEFALTGKPYASRGLSKIVLGFFGQADDPRTHTPAVHVLAGPPGHGKTMAGENLCASIGLNPDCDYLRMSWGNTP
jgi:hypothetical protein